MVELDEIEETEEPSEYDKQCCEYEERNDKLLDLFTDDLIKVGLKDQTIINHLDNVKFFLNVYLLSYGPSTMEMGISKLDDFLGYFFIRKCLWATPATIKSTAASIKKFYKCMLEHEYICQKDYDDLCLCIKENMKHWQESCIRHDNLNPWKW